MRNTESVPIASLLSLLLTCICHSAVYAYNSEEHMLVSDNGVSKVEIPAGVTLPSPIGFEARTPSYLQNYTNAKLLAAGFSTNNKNDYGRYKRAQDNCYWTSYKQLEYNKKIWIPKQEDLPDRIFHVLANTTNQPRSMTFGQMVALYGDYRRTTYCTVTGECYLTDADTPMIEFTGNIMRKGSYCPKPVDSQSYVRMIGSGLVPPFGGLGNATSNTAGDSDYEESGWWGDEMLRIANINDWHFSNVAVAWYVGMHRLALLYVEKATKDPRYWNQALHYEANALHSLTDLFAFGHVVTNRDETSYGIVKHDKLINSVAYVWMNNVVTVGGGKRDAAGRVALNGNLLPIADAEPIRKDFLKSYGGTWLARANAERKYHDYFNKSGATVRNLNETSFVIYGDGKLHDMNSVAQQQISDAVRTSVQSLFDAHEMIVGQSKSADEIGVSGSSYFNALKFIPVYIESDKNNYFTGRWTLYADAVRALTGATQPLNRWGDCQIPYLSGKDFTWPKIQSERCAEF